MIPSEPSRQGLTRDGAAGTTGADRKSFVILLWPYMEETNLAQTYDAKKPFWDVANLPAMMTQVPIYSCPDDRLAFWTGDAFPRVRGNYVVCFGDGGFWGQPLRLTGSAEPVHKAPFADVRDLKKLGRNMRQFSDGLSTDDVHVGSASCLGRLSQRRSR